MRLGGVRQIGYLVDSDQVVGFNHKKHKSSYTAACLIRQVFNNLILRGLNSIPRFGTELCRHHTSRRSLAGRIRRSAVFLQL